MTGENPDRYCTVLSKRDETAGGRAAVLNEAQWPGGQQIQVRFLEGDESLRDRVGAVAERWTAPGMAQLEFIWIDEGPAEIRIAFEQGIGSWSYLGTQCRNVPDDQPTMNFGWLTPDSSDDAIQRVVLHEFGHALGLDHEHENAASGIRWNEPAVYAALGGPPYNWDEQTIRDNVFDEQDVGTASVVDPDSIMLYPIPSVWTLDGTSVDLNPDLSEGDMATIRRMYGDDGA